VLVAVSLSDCECHDKTADTGNKNSGGSPLEMDERSLNADAATINKHEARL
jgi:hypothetical protein